MMHYSEGADSEGRGGGFSGFPLSSRFPGQCQRRGKKGGGCSFWGGKGVHHQRCSGNDGQKQQGHYGRNASKHGQRMDNMKTQTDRCKGISHMGKLSYGLHSCPCFPLCRGDGCNRSLSNQASTRRYFYLGITSRNVNDGVLLPCCCL